MPPTELPPATTSRSSEQPWVVTLRCIDRPGIVHAVSGAITATGGNIIESQQFYDPETGSFFMRVEGEGGGAALGGALAPARDRFGMDLWCGAPPRPLRTLVMASKSEHCLNDLLFRRKAGQLPIEIPAVVSNHPDLRPLCDFYGIDFHHIPVTRETKADSEAELVALIADLGVELVVLARYMQVLSDDLCRALTGRAINIHHSFLPSFKGARPYHQAHARGVKLIGATAHYVTGELDEGPIIEQDVERAAHGDSVRALIARGQEVEARTLSRAVRWHAEHRVLTNGTRTVVFR